MKTRIRSSTADRTRTLYMVKLPPSVLGERQVRVDAWRPVRWPSEAVVRTASTALDGHRIGAVLTRRSPKGSAAIDRHPAHLHSPRTGSLGSSGAVRGMCHGSGGACTNVRKLRISTKEVLEVSEKACKVGTIHRFVTKPLHVGPPSHCFRLHLFPTVCTPHATQP